MLSSPKITQKSVSESHGFGFAAGTSEPDESACNDCAVIHTGMYCPSASGLRLSGSLTGAIKHLVDSNSVQW